MFRFKIDNLFELPSNAYLVNYDGSVIECNETQAKSMGKTKPTDLIGMNCYYDLADNESGENIKLVNQRICRTKKNSIVIEQVAIHNELHTYLSYKTPISNSKNKAQDLLGISIKIDSNKKLPINFLEIKKCNLSTYKLIADAYCKSPMTKIEDKILTKIERTCLYYLICGQSLERIAHALKISRRTVEFYICKMQEKYHCKNTISLVIKAISA